MVRLKNTRDVAVQVAPLDYQTVQPGEVIEVPDDLYGTRVDDNGDTLGNVWPETSWEVQADDDLTVAELREQLKAKGLPTSGTKDELVERLAAAGTEGEEG